MIVWQFLTYVVIYLFGLTAVDRMVTGKLRTDIHGEEFHAYVFAHFLMNQAVALIATLGAPTLLVAVAMYITVVWCWVGGALDFLYFMMRGYIPEWRIVWTWMPFKPRTWQFAIYAFVWLLAIVCLWGYIIL